MAKFVYTSLHVSLLLLLLLQGKYARERGLAQGLSDKADLAGYSYHGKR
jgi:hypothetical protein